jgi:hypothetical protein
MLILSVLTQPGGFDRQVFRTFAGSLDATGFRGDVVMMTTFEEILGGDLSAIQGEIDCLQLAVIPQMRDSRNINCYRYRHFRDYLEPRVDAYDLVMVSDARDVVFQRDISAYPFPSDSQLFLAQEEKLIGECGINSGWIANLYGRQCLKAFEELPVLCSGTTIGTSPAMLQYLERMIEQINEFDEPFRTKFGSLGGIDQGIHNYLYHSGRLHDLDARPMPNGANLVYTVGHVAGDDPERAFLDDQSRFNNQDGELCYCVHQFDRLEPGIREAFNRNSPFRI